MNIFVGNVAYASTEESLRKEFENFGVVSKVAILKDRVTGIPRGFGFVEMASKEEAEAAISALHGKEVLGLVLNVNEARVKKENSHSTVRGQDGDWSGNGHSNKKRYWPTMIQELSIRNPPVSALRFKKYFESKNNRVRIFGQCEVTGKNFEISVPVEGFFVYLQGFKIITEALASTPQEEREFISTGVSPEGQKFHTN
jgi:RNA recognition motif-containing protein